MVNYTKGERKVQLSVDPLRTPDKIYADGTPIALLGDNVANANLIAAAPEMYEALKLLIERFGDMDGKYQYPMALDLPRVWAEKALAKVEGGE